MTTTVRIDPRLVGCGCFGCSGVVVLAGCLVLVTLVTTVLVPNWSVNHRYVPGTCRVVETKLGAHVFNAGGPGGVPKESYRPEIKIRYEVKGRIFENWSYDATGIYSDNRAAQQAVVNSFRAGATYPFWYDPDRPDQAVLVRGSPWGGYVFLIVPVGLLALGGVGILLAWKILPAGQVPATAPNGSSAPEPPPPAFLRRLATAARDRDATTDPARFGDPVAMKADWTPLGGSSVNFQTRTLDAADPDRLRFRATVGAWLIALALVAMGTLLTLAVVADFSPNRIAFNSLLGIAIGLGLAALGGFLLYTFNTPVVLDKQSGYFWKGWKAPDEAYDGDPGGDSVRLGEIHAVQILGYVVTGRPPHTVYELNLVLNNGERITLAGYVNPRWARRDAAAVAGFLGRRVWDASSPPHVSGDGS